MSDDATLNVDSWLNRIDTQARELAITLRDASDAGVPHALVLPRLMLVFRETFGAMPEGFSIPGVQL